MPNALVLFRSFVALLLASLLTAQQPPLFAAIRAQKPQVVLAAGEASEGVRATQVWNGDDGEPWEGDDGYPSVTNTGDRAVHVREVVLFDLPHGLPATTPCYGEGLQMLAQTGGTLAQPFDIGDYPDRSHYRLPEPAGMRRVYSLLTLELAPNDHLLLAFASCARFVGAFDCSRDRLRCVVDTEGLALAPGKELQLEGLTLLRGPDRGALLARLAERLQQNHPRSPWPAPPTGWCSWYCFGPKVTAQNVLDNLAVMQREHRDLRFVQIDDGYQPTMGDWLDTGPGFGGKPVQDILRAIAAGGREPAIWVAPFVASPDARVLREHPDWFVQGDDGKPLPSDRVQFGGWRLGPWYVLDGTHPDVQRHLERTFRTMREQWGVRYFKLDATYWGMLRGGHRRDANATRVEAYRLGMAAIRRGAGADAYLLGCNHPLWPSLGLIDGSRSSLDIDRNWRSVSRTGRENLLRGWQNGRLWWNDPDTLVTTGLPADEARFHATLVYATGGAVLAGDDLTQLTAQQRDVVRALSKPSGVAASFADQSLRVGAIDLGGGVVRYAVFHWDDAPGDQRVEWRGTRRVRDVWTGDDLGEHADGFDLRALPPHSARLLEATPVAR